MNYLAHGVLLLEAQYLLNDVENRHKIDVWPGNALEQAAALIPLNYLITITIWCPNVPASAHGALLASNPG